MSDESNMAITFFMVFAFVGCMLFYFAIAIGNTYEQFAHVALFMAGMMSTIISGIVAVCRTNEEGRCNNDQ